MSVRPDTKVGADPSDHPASIIDRREFKRLIQQMSRALRDSEGGGIMERFEAVSKLLFTKMIDEREQADGWNGLRAKPEADLRWTQGDSERVVYERARAVWQRAVAAYPKVFAGSRSEFPADVAGVARIVRILEPINLGTTADDVKGAAYEELLRNTFEKNENQQYFTPRHVVDFVVALCSPEDDDSICDPAAGSGGFLVGALAYIRNSGGDSAGVASRMRGAEVDERMAWIARINMLLHGGDPRSIFHLTGAGSLAPLMQLRQSLPSKSFSLIITNPPFGSDMTDIVALRSFDTGKKRSSRRRGILFVERCLQLLSPGGRLAIVLDDSALNLPTNSDVRALIRREAIVEAVISLPDVTFMPYSTAKSSILVVRRRAERDVQGPVFMADVENVGNRPNGDPLYAEERDEAGNRTLKSDLPAVLDYFRRFREGAFLEHEFEGTTVFTANIDDFEGGGSDARLDVFFFHPTRKHAQQRLAHSSHLLRRLDDLAEIDGTAVSPATQYGEALVRWIGLGDIEAETGRFEVKELSGDRIRSNAHVFQPGDVLFSRLRPKLRKVVRIPEDDDGGLCSSELLVLRVRPEAKIATAFLAYLLRSDLVFGQLIYQITGIGRPRVGLDAVKNVVLPVPPLPAQRRLLRQLASADRDVNRLRAEAHRKLEEAARKRSDTFERVLGELAPGQPGATSSCVGSGSAASSAVAAARRAASA